MGREKRKAILPAGASGAKERHKRVQRAQFDPSAPIPERLVARPSVPKSKHHTYFEFVENKERKKKLEVQVTRNKTPPPGFEFVPIGNPVLTSACKELSRERDAMIFIVSNVATNCLSQQVNRLGHHVRQTIVEAARESIAHLPQSGAVTPDGKPEPIPESQAEYHAQADAALRDLFPRIPNTDRQIIIEHAFTRVSILPHGHSQCSLTNRTISQRKNGKAEQPVGFSDDIPLARRVQLAVLAHIRHAHTRYDELLKEAGYQMARRAVEELCLDIIVKWRGDEETGRDQLDEILREVVIISDSEGDESDAETTDDSSVEDSGSTTSVTVVPNQSVPAQPIVAKGRVPSPEITAGPSRILAHPRGNYLMASGDLGPQPHSRKDQRGFKRYRAWQDAILRNREPGVQGSDFISGDNGEYDPLHPQIHMETRREGGQQSPMAHNDGGPCRATGLQVGNSIRARCSPPLLPRRMATTPYVVPYTAESQPPGDGSYLLAYGHATNGAPLSSRQMPPPTHRLRDLLVPSIEGASRESMKPAFVRSVPPRQLDPMDNLHSRTQETYHHPSSIPSMEAFREDMARPGGQRVTRDQSAQGMQPVNASRPGTRSNPIVMEDRGGFYERISVVPVPGPTVQDDDCRSANLAQEASTATHSYGRAVAPEKRVGVMHEGQQRRPSIEIISLPRSGPVPYSERFRQQPPEYSRHPTDVFNQPLTGSDAAVQQWPGQYAGQRWTNVQERPYLYSEQSPSQDRNHVYRLRGKRPADDDHYYYSARIRRPRSRHSEDVIVLD
ncbi:uncharacterized protein CPUR_06647 [Claviceps purpurea 20.1]|uniref:DUF2293 domain-containing protein n=1 Tax=Claviceps purpurea (strain 20.1) TaxID=1111077 RepID=M1VXC5_CLAP2|nr:uncharacterized protein CPUR_06647 [Claviceps purpurea 20.1]